MLKFALLAGAMTIAAPAIAQTAANPTPGTATTTQTAPATTAAPASPAQTMPAAPAATAPMDSAAAPAPTEQAATQPAATGDQVAQVVDTEFPTYDTNKDGKLSETEFGAWMVVLKSKTDPTTKAGTPATKKWVDAAFAQADTDKSKSLSKTELTGFLSQGQS